MPTITKTFLYTGTVQEVVIPAGTTSVDISIWGGAGGGGGGDAGGPGGVGAAGHYVTASSIDLTSYVGQTLKVGVGGGGAGGASGGGAPGGVNGKSITGYSGGRGGNAGPTPYSGGGGAGGGATVILIDSTEIAIAGGGGGGAGAGKDSNGTAGINSNSATAGSPLTLGENGADHSGDGGGGGGAGGGDAGGVGGNGGSGDNGGTGGYSGSNLVPGGGTENNGSGQTPGGTGDAGYQSGVAVGANAANTGGNGLAVLTFNVGVQAKYKVSGAWKDTSNLYYKVSGAWKQITAAYIKASGTWKAIFNSGIDFLSTAAGFGDVEGNTSSGTPGSGGGCFLAGTPIMMADGTTKPVELVDLRDEVAVGGYVFATGKFLIDNLYDYKGIKVSGEHMVKEDGVWMRVKDSVHAVSMGDDEHVVYVFGTEYRRILINGVEFTDYFEISEKEELFNHGDKFFGIWQDHDRQIHEKNVKILNDSQ
jgi:hypothetical protein